MRSRYSKSSRGAGIEVRAVVWALRHPLVWGLPAAVLVAVRRVGPVPVVTVVGLVLAGVAGWYRVHPGSYDRLAGPWLRSSWRRWAGPYAGWRWERLLTACDLVTYGRRDDRVRIPRVVRVRSVSPSVDVVTVRLMAGQKPGDWIDRCEELATALRAERVAVVKHKPQQIRVIVERCNPFEDRPIPAVDIPADVGEVNPAALEIGDTEYATPFTVCLAGQHLLCVGAIGAGKGSVMWSVLRGLGPWITSGHARVWMIDLKGGMETELGAPLFYRRAVEFTDAVALVQAFREDMRARQRDLTAGGRRKVTYTPHTPLNILIIDEMAMLTALGDAKGVREVVRTLAEIMTQGRATGHAVAGFLQEPTKDVLPVRDLFTVRACLAVTTASHVDMTLGDGARDRGALADEIPLDPEHAGQGFVIMPRTRQPIRIRAAYTRDADIDELVARCAPRPRLAAVPTGTDLTHEPPTQPGADDPDDFDPDQFTDQFTDRRSTR